MDYKQLFSDNVVNWWKGRLSENEAISAIDRWREEDEKAKKASKLWKKRLANMMDDEGLKVDEVRVEMKKRRRQHYTEWNDKMRIKFIEISTEQFAKKKDMIGQSQSQEPLVPQDDPFYLCEGWED